MQKFDDDDRKFIRRDNINQKKSKKDVVSTDLKDNRKKVKSFKQKRQSYSNDEEWDEWQEYYRQA